MLTNEELHEILDTLKQFQDIQEGDLVLVQIDEVKNRVLRGIRHSITLIKKELVRRK